MGVLFWLNNYCFSTKSSSGWIFTLVLCCGWWIFIHRFNQRNYQGPKTWPVVGCIVEQAKNFNSLHDWLLHYFKRTPTFCVPMMTVNNTFTSSPANVEYILKTNFTNFPKGEKLQERFNEVLGKGIFNVDGDLWHQQRKVSTVEFSSSKLRDFSTHSFCEQALKLSIILLQAAKSSRVVDLQKKVDILSRFMSISSADAYDDKMLRDVVVNFIIAGRDTTALTLSWFFSLLSKHPRVANNILLDISSVLDHDGFDPAATEQDETEQAFLDRIMSFANRLNYQNLNRMHYLHAAITETLRLYPAVPLESKKVAADDTLPDGTPLKEGNFVSFAPYSMGRLERLWGPDVNEFKPERWLVHGVFQPQSPFKLTAFQAGPRICLGKDSAYLQMKMTTAILLKFFNFQLITDQPLGYKMMVVLYIANGLKAHVSLK